jgi:hypothetical protein
MRYRTTLRENTLALKLWLNDPGLRIRAPRYKRGWKLQGRTNEVWQGGVRFWMDVRRVT